ncbi:MAG: hypothetical protein HPAVJP_1750 [Candidatus Hepatoplasma vulgare]|nr:MAG: hypothetical protein HPAVJP_1750 [Candidatus Hepatoplasma sp.]
MKENKNQNTSKNLENDELETLDRSSISFKKIFKRNNKKSIEKSKNTTKIFSTSNLDKEKEEEISIEKTVPEKIREKIDFSYILKQQDNNKIEKEKFENLKKKIINLREEAKVGNDISEYNKNSNIYLNHDYDIPGYNDKRIEKTERNNTMELNNKFIELAKKNIKDPTGEMPSFKDALAQKNKIDNVVNKSFLEATGEISFSKDENSFSTKETIIKSIKNYENDNSFKSGYIIQNNIPQAEEQIKEKDFFLNNNDFEEDKLDWNFNDTFVNEEINYFKEYKYPPLDLFLKKERDTALYISERKYAEEIKLKLEEIFKHNNLDLKIVDYDLSNRVISYSVKLPAHTNINDIVALEENIKIHLNVKNVRIQLPIPDKSLIGIEIAFTKGGNLSFIETYLNINKSFNNNTKGKYKIFLGKDIYNKNLSFDLLNYSNILIIGNSENGKNNLINLFIISLLMNYNPQELNFILIDPIGTELMSYHNLPHLLMPVVNETKKAFDVFNSIIQMLKERYILMMKNHVRNIEELNEKLNDNSLAKILIIVNEFSSLYTFNPSLFNKFVSLIKERGKKAGVFFVVASDKPKIDFLNSDFLRDFDLRLLTKTEDINISKAIIKKNGGEKLLFGDDFLIWKKNDISFRAQSSYISREEIDKIVYFLERKTAPKYQMHVEEDNLNSKYFLESSNYIQAAKIILCRKSFVSIPLLQRELNINETVAKKIEDTLEYLGIIEKKRESINRRYLLKKEICYDKKHW